MVFGFFLLVIIIILWLFFIEGWIWKMALGIFGWLGMYWALINHIPSSQSACISLSGSNFSWATVIPTIVLFMAMAYTKE